MAKQRRVADPALQIEVRVVRRAVEEAVAEAHVEGVRLAEELKGQVRSREPVSDDASAEAQRERSAARLSVLEEELLPCHVACKLRLAPDALPLWGRASLHAGCGLVEVQTVERLEQLAERPTCSSSSFG